MLKAPPFSTPPPPEPAALLAMVWIRGQEASSLVLPVHGDGALVVGSNSQCEIWLEGDRLVAARHALIRWRRGRVEWIDLHPSAGLPSTPTGELARLTAGEHEILAAVVGDDGPIERGIRHCRARELRLVDPEHRNSWMFEISTGSTVARAQIDQKRLEQGLVLGRASLAALDPSLDGPLGGRVSRRHVFVRREGNRIVGFDLASTNGTFSRGRAVDRFVLSHSSDGVWLGGPGNGVRLRCVGRVH